MKGVFFDLDGTLTDSKRTILRCLNKTLSEFGFSEYIESELYPLIGTLDRMRMIYKKAGEVERKKLEDMTKFYNQLYLSTHKHDTNIFDGILEMLAALKGHGILTGVITIKKGYIARRVIEDLGLEGYIDVVIGDGDAKLKPEPDPILAACSKLGIDPQECVMVGDTVNDIVSGKVAGCKTIGVLWGAGKAKDLKKIGADWIVQHPKEIQYIIIPDELVRLGAEAEIHKTLFMGRNAVQKKRVHKKYRIEEVDAAIREARTKEEARLIMAARNAGMDTPIMYDINLSAGCITMEFVEGIRIKEFIENNTDDNERRRLCRRIGRYIAMLHKNGIVHGDLTTSNIILRPNGSLCFIDFGLGEFSKEIEKQGVDLHVLMEAFESTHSRHPYCFREVMKGYKADYTKGAEVEKKIREITMRGRYMRAHEVE